MFYHRHSSHSSFSSMSSYSHGSYYSEYKPGTDTLSHWIATQILNCSFILVMLFLFLIIYPTPFFSHLPLIIAFIIVFIIATYFIFWLPDMECQSCMNVCAFVSWFLGIIFVSTFLSSFAPLFAIETTKAKDCTVINGEEILLGYEKYTALNVSFVSKDGQQFNGYGCLSSEKYGERSEVTSEFITNVAVCVKKDQADQNITKTITYNDYYSNFMGISQKNQDIQDFDIQEEQQQQDGEIELNQLDVNDTKRILRVGGGSRGGGSRGGGSRSSRSRSTRSGGGTYYSRSTRSGRRRSKSYYSSYYHSSYYESPYLYYGGYGYHYGYGHGYHDYDSFHSQGNDCKKVVEYAMVKLPAWLCGDLKKEQKIAYTNKCYYHKYGKANARQAASSIDYDPKLQSSFYLITFDKDIYYDKSGFNIMLIIFFIPWLVCGNMCCCVNSAFSLEKWLMKNVVKKKGRYHPSYKKNKKNQEQNQQPMLPGAELDQPPLNEIPLQNMENFQNNYNQSPNYDYPQNNNNNHEPPNPMIH